ncbi:MAG: zinc ribbon domain-containing protein [Anaerolineae bacterium]|nr:zinc ribbon domain-containing protein [Anaerolineae bacterium]
MPIYEYYCSRCHGRFRHLAKHVDASAPPCPRCGNIEITRQVSAASVLHAESHHVAQLQEAKREVDQKDSQAIARFLQNSGRLADADGIYGSKVYRELLARKADGASDADVADLVPGLVSELQSTEGTQMAGAMLFSEQVENRMGAEGPPEHHETESSDVHSTPSARTRRRADDLGWA